MTLVLAADLGGTTVKAALVEETGQIAIQVVLPAPESRPDGMVEPAGWWQRFCDCCGELARDQPSLFATIRAVAVTGVTRTPIVLDAQGEPIAPAITARDARAQDVCKPIDPTECAEATHYDAFHPAARLQWLEAQSPGLLARANTVVDPKDYVAARLTGRIAGDPISLARLIAATDGSPSLFARLGLPALLPEIMPATATIGTVRAGLEPLQTLAGRPVIMTAHDTWASVVGLGALTPGRAYNVSGTTETFGIIASRPATAEGLIDLAWGEGLHQLGGPGQNGADVLGWLGRILGASEADIAPVEAALQGKRHDRPLLFLPFLSGERVPFWDADLRAAFLGLSRQHGPTDLACAVLEGVALVNRTVLWRAERAASLTVDEVRLGGGAARSANWAQVKADVLKRPVTTTMVEEAGVLGAAITAFVGLGAFPSLAQAQATLVRPARRFMPRPGMRDFYDALALLFDEAHAAVRPISHHLAKLAVPSRSGGTLGA